MKSKISDSLTFAMFCIFLGGFLLGGYISVIVKNEQIQDRAVNHNAEINRLLDDYEAKVASKELQVEITQSSYRECSKRYAQPRSIVCD